MESSGFLKCLIKGKLQRDVRILDLRSLRPTRSSLYSPKLLMNLCLGLLKLAEIDGSLRACLLRQIKPVSVGAAKVVVPVQSQKEATRRKTIKDVIELWLESESPYENEQARVLLKFVSKLRISNDVLLEWITKRPAVYHQASDLLLEYIAEHWSKV